MCGVEYWVCLFGNWMFINFIVVENYGLCRVVIMFVLRDSEWLMIVVDNV